MAPVDAQGEMWQDDPSGIQSLKKTPSSLTGDCRLQCPKTNGNHLLDLAELHKLLVVSRNGALFKTPGLIIEV